MLAALVARMVTGFPGTRQRWRFTGSAVRGAGEVTG